MKNYYLFVILAFCFFTATAQKLVYTTDIDRFWTAYDRIHNTPDSATQVQLMQQLYIDPGTAGLKAFMKARDYDAKLYVQLIRKYPKFWQSIRKNTLQIKSQEPAINKSVANFKKLYPEIKPASMYFTIGGLRSGGTTTGDMVLIGTEIASADQNTDASELSDWLKNVFKNQNSANIVALNVHEYVHTQQKMGGNTVLSQCIAEGAADFIAELVMQKPNNSTYMIYGREHEADLKEKFKTDMFSPALQRWLYNGSSSGHADLGYFIGYRICQAYYQRAADKKQAIKTIIELNTADDTQVEDFLRRSSYYPAPIDKAALQAKFGQLQPYVLSLSPAIEGQKNVSAALTELTINFSQPMTKDISISLGDSGTEHFPFTGVIGYAEDKRSLKLKMTLKPGTAYEFVLTDRSFKSQDGYPLKERKVQFEVQ